VTVPEGSPPSRLPGVGERLDVTDTDGRALQVVRRLSGHVELHSAGNVVELDPSVAEAVGAFASGHFRMRPEIVERLTGVLGGLSFEWVSLREGHYAVGRTIEELAVRRRTGVTIVAVLRGSIPIVAPEPSIVLEACDDLVIACRDEDLHGFVRYMTEGT
jgi:TrkA domain protein